MKRKETALYKAELAKFEATISQEERIFEMGLPDYVKEDIAEYKKAVAGMCADDRDFREDLWDQALRSDINCMEVDGDISSDEAWRMREIYFGAHKEE